jgi:dTDP-4-dehydrorhamnose 3,5-epimerase
VADWHETAIAGVFRTDLSPIADARGSFMELWRAGWTDPLGSTFRQANLSRSEASVLRGMHFHERQDDLWIVLEGRGVVATVDLRGLVSGAAREPTSQQLEAGPGTAIYIPAGVAHGFLAREPLALLYLVTNEYDGTDEHGFAWDDPGAGLSWPLDAPIVSGRDAANPSLAAAVEAARQRGALVTPGSPRTSR